MNPFEVLQISPGASPDEVREAYRHLAKKWHPDRFSGQEKQISEARFREIAQAYAALKNGADPVPAVQPGAASFAMPPSRSANDSPAEKTPMDWLSEAKKALGNKQYDAAVALSQYCFNYSQVAEEARLIYATVIGETSKDIRALTRAYEEVIRVNPNNKTAIAKLAELYLALNMPTRAAGMCSKAKALGIVIKPRQDAPRAPGKKQGASRAGAIAAEFVGVKDKIAGFFRIGVKRG